MKQILIDWFSEEKGGKFSSKKLWGHIFCTLVGVTYVMDGWDYYKINEHLFDSMLIAGTTLLGLGLIKGVFVRTQNSDNIKSK